MDDRFELTVLRTAAPSISLSASAYHEEAITVGTRSVYPTRVARLDLERESIRREYPVPNVGGIRGMVTYRGTTYFGTYQPARLYRIDHDESGLTELGEFSGESFVWDLAAANGCVYAGTYPNATVREYDVETGEVRSLGRAHEDTDYVRSVAATESTVYAGVGTTAQVVAIDRGTGERSTLLPAELTDENMAYELALTDDEVVVRLTPDGIVCAIDRTDSDSFRLLDEGATTITTDAGAVYATCDGEIRRYDADNGPAIVGTAPEEFEPFALAVDGERAFGTASRGRIWRNHFSDDAISVVDFAAAGMSLGAEQPQAALALGERVYVTSHGTLHVHDPDEEVRHVSVPGEGKAMVAVDGRVYFAIYPGAHLTVYDPDADAVETLATIEADQNRPRTIVHDAARDRLFIGTRPDYGHIGGAVSAYELSTGRLTVSRNVVPEQSISAIAPLDSTVALGSEIQGGLGIDPVASEAVVVGWNPETDKTQWTVTPVPGTDGIADLVTVDGLLYGIAATGELFVVDPAEPACIHRGTATDGWTTLERRGDAIFGLSRDAVVHIDPRSFDVTTLVDDLGSEWYGNPRITIDDGGGVYTLSGYDLARLDNSG